MILQSQNRTDRLDQSVLAPSHPLDDPPQPRRVHPPAQLVRPFGEDDNVLGRDFDQRKSDLEQVSDYRDGEWKTKHKGSRFR